jgi:hypothetical protein
MKTTDKNYKMSKSAKRLLCNCKNDAQRSQYREMVKSSEVAEKNAKNAKSKRERDAS